MGGMSFKCPFCPKWFTDGGAFKAHLQGAHTIKNVTIEGTANHITLWHAQRRFSAIPLPTTPAAPNI